MKQAIAVFIVAMFGAVLPLVATADDGDIQRDGDVKREGDIQRYDPIYDQLETIDIDDLKVGYIYRHHSERLNRRVWSFWLGNGRFWHAFGEGTTQLGRTLDIQQQPEDALEKLQAVDPEFAKEIERAASPPRVRLDRDGKWIRIGTQEVLSIYDAETNMRWENHSDRYVPVRTLHSDRWEVRSGKYLPAMTGSGWPHEILFAPAH